MKSTSKKSLNKPTEHEQNIDFAFHSFGFFGINQYRIMVFFWILELLRIPGLLADAYFSQNASWMNIRYNLSSNLWTLSERAPHMSYVGAFIIITALSYPGIIIALLKKATFLEFEIKRSLTDLSTIVYSVFMALLSSRLVDLAIDILDIYYQIERHSFVVF